MTFGEKVGDFSSKSHRLNDVKWRISEYKIDLLSLINVYYSNGYRVTVKNAFCFLGLLNWKVLLTFLFTTGVVVGLGCINYLTLAIGLLLFAITNSVVIVLYTLMSHEMFDKYINKEYYPDMVGKGLYKVNKEA